jgi:hypothetical protein
VWACAPICEKALKVLATINDDYRSIKGDIHRSPRFSFKRDLGGGDIINRQLDEIFKINLIFNFYFLHTQITLILAMTPLRWMKCIDCSIRWFPLNIVR